MPTPDTAGLRDLLERVRAATGSDPRLSQMLFAALWGWSYPLHGSAWTEFEELRHLSDLTGSVDAANASVMRTLPGWKIGTASPDPTRPGLSLKAWAKVEPWLNNDDGWKVGAHEGFAATVPLAILAALLTAKISMEESADAN